MLSFIVCASPSYNAWDLSNADILKENRSIQVLGLQKNHISSKGLVALLKTVLVNGPRCHVCRIICYQHSTLMSVRVSRHSTNRVLNTLWLTDNLGIDDEGASLFSEMLLGERHDAQPPGQNRFGLSIFHLCCL